MSARSRIALAVAACAAASGCIAQAADKAPEPAAAGATVGGVLKVGITKPSTLDPTVADDPAAVLVSSVLCDPLIGRDPDSGELVPALATRWLVTDGGKRINLTLRRGLTFSDGSELTAEDVAASLARVAKVDNASPLADRLRNVVGYDTVHGDKETKSSREKNRLQGVSATDERTVEIELTDPDIGFLSVLTMPLSSPLPVELADSDRDEADRRPDCAGPFRLTADFTGQDVIVAERNRRYHGKRLGLTNGGAGYADRIEFHVFRDAAAVEQAWRRGKVDVAGVRAGSVPALRTSAGAQLVTVPDDEVTYLGLPIASKSFADERVRRAVSLALDRTALADSTYNATMAPARSLVSPSLRGDIGDVTCADAPARPDPAAARALLAEAGAPVTGRVPLYVNDEYGHAQLADAVAKQLSSSLGWQVVVQRMSWNEFVTKATTPPGLDAPFRTSWRPTRPDAEGYLTPLFGQANVMVTNLAGFSDRKFEKRLERQARKNDDPRDGELAYARLIEELCAQMPLVPLLTGSRSYLVRATWSAAGEIADPAGQLLLRELHLEEGTAP